MKCYKIKDMNLNDLDNQEKELIDLLLTKFDNKEIYKVLDLIVEDAIKFHNEMLISMMDRVNRIEVIDENGRSYVNKGDFKSSLSFQDDNRTLKVFINKK